MEPVLQKQTGPVELLHITTGDRLDSIMQKGILASEYGDLSVDDNDGAGIYAIRNETKILRDLINDLLLNPLNPTFQTLKATTHPQQILSADYMEVQHEM